MWEEGSTPSSALPVSVPCYLLPDRQSGLSTPLPGSILESPPRPSTPPSPAARVTLQSLSPKHHLPAPARSGLFLLVEVRTAQSLSRIAGIIPFLCTPNSAPSPCDGASRSSA